MSSKAGFFQRHSDVKTTHLVIIIILPFGCTMQHVISSFPDQGLNPQEVWSLNHWTAREVLKIYILK